jgi:hypothetical protein
MDDRRDPRCSLLLRPHRSADLRAGRLRAENKCSPLPKKIMHSQLSRILLSTEAQQPDEQVAAADEHGAYGELMEAIDDVTSDQPAEAEPDPRPRS